MSVPPSAQNALLGEFQSLVNLQGLAAAHAHLLTRLADTAPANVATWLTTARDLIGAGYVPTATELLDEIVRRFPGNVEALYWRGNALRVSARFSDAEQAFRAALEKQPSHRDAALSLAIMLRDMGRLRAAAETVAASVNTRGDNRGETIAALAFLRECSQHALAHEVAQNALRHWPNDAAIAARAAEFALAIGEFAPAHRALLTALDHNPSHAPSWLRLAYCQRFEREDNPDLKRIERAWDAKSTELAARTCVGFALGKALDDLGDYPRAAEVLREANAMAGSATPWSIDQWQEFVSRRLQMPPLPRVDADLDFTPVFIVGLPRTGTTLAATLLARDPRVRDRGELNWIDGMYRHLADQERLHDPAALRSIAQLVAAQMRRDDTPAQWYVDKNPLNFRFLDLIAAMFPRARIIHCRREPRDTALSIWSQHFAHADLGFAYDFSLISAFTKGCDQLMAHWRRRQILPIFELNYEDLARDTANTMQRLTEFLGMTGSAPAMPSTSTTDAITTASVWQARQPVYTRSIGRWRSYTGHLPELERLF